MTFEELGVCEEIRQAIDELGFVQPMPVQEAVIPYLLEGDNDVIALAQTGTGKTAAFGIPLLQRIAQEKREMGETAERAMAKLPMAVVLSPTRELCLQIADDLNSFAKYIDGVHIVAVYGGAPIDSQIRALKKGAQVIVATPGRLIDLINRKVAKMDCVKSVVLDEADEMLNMGFSESINAIFESIPDDRKTLLFSATMSREIEGIAKSYLKKYEEIVVGSRNEGAENVNHVYYMVNAKDKYLALKRIVDFYPKIYAIVFCRTKIETQEVADLLIRDGYNAESLHGDLSQQQRDLTMQKFRKHLTQLLIATDVAARGLDVDDLTHVINYGMPDDIESYTHRSGRTGRAGKQGTSIAIIHSRERHKIKAVEKQIGKEFVEGEIPSSAEICKKQLYKVMDQIVKTDVDDEQIKPFMHDINRYFEYIDKDELIKKIVTREFGRFMEYYANAPEIEKVTSKSKDKGQKQGGRQKREYNNENMASLRINLGKRHGFYPGEVMQMLNRRMSGRQEVGHIELKDNYVIIDVPRDDAGKVQHALNGTSYHG
ncbi:MAG: DEAD/DEAH box helicase, partial [Prevotella sp.]|nr:DEAD/DEAH box helicase [Prevotella sp.]